MGTTYGYSCRTCGRQSDTFWKHPEWLLDLLRAWPHLDKARLELVKTPFDVTVDGYLSGFLSDHFGHELVLTDCYGNRHPISVEHYTPTQVSDEPVHGSPRPPECGATVDRESVPPQGKGNAP